MGDRCKSRTDQRQKVDKGQNQWTEGGAWTVGSKRPNLSIDCVLRLSSTRDWKRRRADCQVGVPPPRWWMAMVIFFPLTWSHRFPRTSFRSFFPPSSYPDLLRLSVYDSLELRTAGRAPSVGYHIHQCHDVVGDHPTITSQRTILRTEKWVEGVISKSEIEDDFPNDTHRKCEPTRTRLALGLPCQLMKDNTERHAYKFPLGT